MKKHGMPDMKESGVNVTPLIDVVMCLIIFFMLVAKIGVATGALPMELPQTIMGKKMESLGDTLILNVVDPNPPVEAEGGGAKKDEKGHIIRKRIRPDPTVSAMLDESDKEPQPLVIRTESGQRQLYNELKRVYDAKAKQGKQQTFSISLRAERDLPFSMLQAVLVDIADAGIRNVNYGAKARTETTGAAE